MLTVSWFYETFTHLLHEWSFMVLAISFFIVTWVIKTGGIYLSGFWKFRNCMLVTFLSNLIFFGGLFALLFFQFKPFVTLHEFYGFLCITAIGIDVLFVTFFSRKTNWLRGIFGVLLADSFIIAGMSAFFAFRFYLLA